MNRRQSVKSRKLSKVSLAAIAYGLAAGVPLFPALAQSAHEHHSDEAPAPAQDGGARATATVDDVNVNLGHSHGGGGAGEKRQEEVLTKTPRSGDVITATTIHDQQIDNLTDVSYYLPGL
jgi:iron complex outermembrane recepter protein